MQLPRPTRGQWIASGLVAAAFVVGAVSGPLLDTYVNGDSTPAPGSRLTFAATAYCKGTTTASGVRARRGVAAADRTVLPPGSVVSLSTGDAEFDGVYTVLDTGPAVQGRLLDLYVWSCHEALAFGRREVQATILRLGWDPRESAESLANRLLHRRNVRKARPAEPDEPDVPDTALEPVSAVIPRPDTGVGDEPADVDSPEAGQGTHPTRPADPQPEPPTPPPALP